MDAAVIATTAHLPLDGIFIALVVNTDWQVATLVKPPESAVRRIAALLKGSCLGRAGQSDWRFWATAAANLATAAWGAAACMK